MHIGLWIKGKKFQFSGDFGWYRGNEFTLLTVQLLEFFDDKLHTIFAIQIAKFSIGLYISAVD